MLEHRTLGTPHGGTYNSYWLWSRVGAELRSDSLLLGRLRAARPAERVEFISVTAGADNLVVPRVFATHGQDVVVGDVGHLSMLFSPTVLNLVAERLQDGPAVAA